MNDEKISAIGRYIRLNLVDKVVEETGHPEIESVFGWKTYHRSDQLRKRRKIEQLIVDEITFVISGIIALMAFWLLVPQSLLMISILSWMELLLLLVLGVEIAVYADLAEGR